MSKHKTKASKNAKKPKYKMLHIGFKIESLFHNNSPASTKLT